MAVQLPTLIAVGDLLGDLVGKRPKVAKCNALLPTAVRAVATYIDDTGKVAVTAFVDITLLAVLGAAIAMIPRGSVEDAVRAGKPSDALLENAYEVLNIAASLFNVDATNTHVKIDKLAFAPPAADVTKAILASKIRLDVDVCIPGYPDGKLTLVAAA